MQNQDIQLLQNLTERIRRDILTSTTEAESGHPSSSLSAVELMTTLMFGGFLKFDVKNPELPNNDRLIFSKGHASPLFYALWAAAGVIPSEELLTLRQLDSRLEGHPTRQFPLTEVPTGSLGQGLSIGAGMALAANIDSLSYRTFVLLGDSELAEGSNWEAMQFASFYKLGNLIGILDVNRLGQRGETMYGHDLDSYERKIQAFGWRTYKVDGHSFEEIVKSYQEIEKDPSTPLMIIAKTMKGKGVSLLENQEGWHGKALNKEQLSIALQELGEVDTQLTATFTLPENIQPKISPVSSIEYQTDSAELVATKKAVAEGILPILEKHPEIIVLDAEVSNSTHTDIIKKNFPDHFYEMYIAEQNMVGVALGLARRGKVPIVSTFAAFMTRAFDQIRMAGQAEVHIIYHGPYSGVSVGKDGGSQMGLEDIALFRTVFGSCVLYPADAVSARKMMNLAVTQQGSVYIRSTREPTPIIYSEDEIFEVGGSKVLKHSENDQITIISAGITLHEALKAYEQLKNDGIDVRIIDLYSIKPIDQKTLALASQQTKALIVVEDHYPEGGIADAVRTALSKHPVPVISLAVRKMPHSGKPEELLKYEGIDSSAIIQAVHDIVM